MRADGEQAEGFRFTSLENPVKWLGRGLSVLQLGDNRPPLIRKVRSQYQAQMFIRAVHGWKPRPPDRCLG